MQDIINIITLYGVIETLKLYVCAISALLLLSLSLSSGLTVPSFAHETVSVGKYDIEAGWGIEPPIVGLRNSVVVSVMERGEMEGQATGVTHAFRGVDATIFFGGESKLIAFSPENLPGHYYSPIIPTKTGTYLVQIVGDVRGMPVDVTIPIEDVEHTAALDFPPVPGGVGSGGGGADSADVVAIKKAVTAIQQDLLEIKSGEAVVPRDGGGIAYNFAVLGLSMSAAAVVLGVVALTRRTAA